MTTFNSLFRKNGEASKLSRQTNALRDELRNQGADRAVVGTLVSNEAFTSLDSPQGRDLITSMESAYDMIQRVYSAEMDAGDDVANEVTEAGMQAGAVAAVAAQDPASYAEVAMRSQAEGSSDPANTVKVMDSELSGSNGSVDTVDPSEVSNEAYDERNLTDFAHYSISYNMNAPRQDALAEGFFRTVVVPAQQGGLDVKIDTLNVLRSPKHSISGRPTDFQKRNLIDAFVDHTILANDEIQLVPHRLTNDSNADRFVDSALVAPYVVNVAGVPVTTAPLKTGVDVNLLGISTHPSLIGTGVFNETDTLDPRLTLDAIYAKTSDNKTLRFDTKNLPRNQFQKTPEGHHQEVGLQFFNRTLVLDKNSKAADGSTTTDLATIANWTVRVSVNLFGIANVETANCRVNPGFLRCEAIYDEQGNEVDKETSGKTLADAINAMEIVGYSVNARRTNANHRTLGLLVDNQSFVERWAIPVGSPITARRPIGNKQDQSDLKSLIVATNAKNTSDAITTLLNYCDTLAAYVRGPKFSAEVPEIVGSGRHFVTPFYEEQTLDLKLAVNSISSHERLADIRGAFHAAISELASRMLRDSKYMPALQAYHGQNAQVELLIGTDQRLEQFLMIPGDTRTFGEQFRDFKIVTTADRRMWNTIILSLNHKGSTGVDPFSPGVMGWMPQLVSTVNMTRDGGHSAELRVHPRKLHIPMLPVFARINVKNLASVLAEKTNTPVLDNPGPQGEWEANIVYKY